MLRVCVLLAAWCVAISAGYAGSIERGVEVKDGGSVGEKTASEKRALFQMNGNKEDEYYGYTPIINAARSGDVQRVSEHLEQGEYINWKTDFGYTSLMFASDGGHENLVRLLLANGADKAVAGNDGETALSLATQNGNSEIIKLLK